MSCDSEPPSSPRSDGGSGSSGLPAARERTKRKKKMRPEEAPGLRQETIEHPVSERVRKCPYCGQSAQPIGTGKFTTEWDYVPGYFVRRRHIQEVVACPCGKHIAHAEACACSTARSTGPAYCLPHREQVRRLDADLPRRETLRATGRADRAKHVEIQRGAQEIARAVGEHPALRDRKEGHLDKRGRIRRNERKKRVRLPHR